MPRPLHDRNFGNTSGSSIKVHYHNGSTATTGYIVKQLGSRKFRVTSNGSDTFAVELAQTTDAAQTLTAGYCTIQITPYGGGPVEYVKKITSRRVVTTAGNIYSWGYALSSAQARVATNGDDTTPSAFSFTDETGATTSTLYTSAPVTLAGLTAPATITVSGTAGAAYNINGGTFKTTAGTVVNGDVVRARVTSSSSANTAVTATVTIGGVSDTYSVTTA